MGHSETFSTDVCSRPRDDDDEDEEEDDDDDDADDDDDDDDEDVDVDASSMKELSARGPVRGTTTSAAAAIELLVSADVNPVSARPPLPVALLP